MPTGLFLRQWTEEVERAGRSLLARAGWSLWRAWQQKGRAALSAPTCRAILRPCYLCRKSRLDIQQ